MQSRRESLLVAGLAVVAAVVLFIVLSGGDDTDNETTIAQTTTTSTPTNETTTTTNETTTTTTIEAEPAIPKIVVKNGQPVGGVQDLEFSESDEIRFEVESDVDAEVHFHGYDISKAVEAGGRVEFNVPATIPGVFEVELEETATPIAEITVD